MRPKTVALKFLPDELADNPRLSNDSEASTASESLREDDG
jgi:hypothetical protein